MGIVEAQNRLIRGRVLKLLRAVDFNHLAADVLVATLAGCGHQLNIQGLLGILQYLVDLIDEIPCPDSADVDKNGVIDATDPLLILQFLSAFFPSLPPPSVSGLALTNLW